MIFVPVFMLAAALTACQGHAVQRPRIWAGEQIPIEEMPWMIQLEERGYPTCGGVILSKDFILTAAQCTNPLNNQYRVRAGATQYNSGGSTHHVKYIYTHPEYDIYSWEYDVAVAKVDPPFVLDTTRQPIRLGSRNPAIGSVGSIAGWGATKEDSFNSESLMAENVTITGPNEDCDPKEDLQFCATGSFCSGDWGGPFVQDGVDLGVASLRDNCYNVNTYTSVIADTNREFIITTAGLNYN